MIGRIWRLLTFRQRGATAVDPAAIPFLPDAVAIEERAFPPAARSVVYIVMGLIVAAGLWSTFSQIDRVVTAHGKLITVDPLMVVQPLETAVIRTIDVGVGDFVRAGMTLATLDPTFTQSQEVAGQERLSSMRAEEQRLEDEIYGRSFPTALVDETLDPKYLKLQEAIYVHRRSEYLASVAAYDADVVRLEAALTTNRGARDGLKQRLAIIGQVESMRQELLRLDAGSKLNLLMTQLDRHNLGDQLREKENQEKELLQQLAAAREQKEKYVNNWVREAGERLTTLQQNISTAVQQLETAERRRTLQVLRAPADGIVLELAQRSIGSVAKEAEPLITLVPQGNRVEAEVEVDSADVAHLRVGDPVRLKLEALPYQRHGTLAGILRVITENSFQTDKRNSSGSEKPESQSSFFRARITLESTKLEAVPKDFHLIPGMTTTAEINIGKRTIISYLMDPVVRLFDESLREP